MGLIKSADAPARMSPFSMRDIEKQAKAILLRTRQEAERVLAAVQVEAEGLKAQARIAGFAEGRERGLAQGREEGQGAGREEALGEQRSRLGSLVDALSRAMEEVNRSRLELQAAATRDVIRLAIAIAERVTKRLGVLDGEVVVANVVEAMKLVSHASDVRIAVHPSQKGVLEEVLPQLKRQWPKLEHVELVEDEGILPGGCRVLTAKGVVDGDLEEQLGRIVSDLFPGVEEGI